MKRMKMGKLLALTAVAIGVLVLGATALAATRSKVTIQGNNGDYFGYVHSPKGSCEAGRVVKVYKLEGSSPKPSNDTKIGSDIAQPNGPDSMWSIGNSGFKKGFFYARIKPTTKCNGDISDVIKG